MIYSLTDEKIKQLRGYASTYLDATFIIIDHTIVLYTDGWPSNFEYPQLFGVFDNPEEVGQAILASDIWRTTPTPRIQISVMMQVYRREYNIQEKARAFLGAAL